MSDTEKETIEVKYNPLTEKLKKIPGETFRLPSRGLFYKDGELDASIKDGEVVVYPMVTIDELAMRSPDMLLQGTAIEQTISRCVPSVLKPLRLLSGDVDYLLTCLRKVSYGEYLPIKHKCKTCGVEEQAKEYDIPITHFLKSVKEFTPEDAKKLSVNIANTFTVKLKPAVFEELLAVYQNMDENVLSSTDSAMTYIVRSMLVIITQVDDITDKALIEDWLRKLPRNYMEELTVLIPAVNSWGVEFDYTITCKKCATKENITAGLNPTSFFTIPSSQKIKPE